MFHFTIAVFLCCGFFLLILLRWAPPRIGYRPVLLSLFCVSHPHGLPLPCTLLGLPPRVVFSLPTSFVVTVLRGGVMSYLSWGFPYPPPLFPTRRRLPFHYFRLPATSGSFFSSLRPYLVSSVFAFTLLVPAPSLSLGLPPLVAFFLIRVRLVLRLGVGGNSVLGGAPSTPPPPFTIRDCRISQFCAATCCLLLLPLLYTHPYAWVTSFVFFMSYSRCAFFYCSFFFFSLDSLPILSS